MVVKCPEGSGEDCENVSISYQSFHAFPGDKLPSEFTLCEPLCSSCLRVKKKLLEETLLP